MGIGPVMTFQRMCLKFMILYLLAILTHCRVGVFYEINVLSRVCLLANQSREGGHKWPSVVCTFLVFKDVKSRVWRAKDSEDYRLPTYV